MCNIAGNICPDIVDKFEEVPLSARTITRRIEDVGDNLLNQLINITKTFQYFSLALDESTDIVDSAQLIIFIRGINEKFEITEEIAAVSTLKGTTRGEDIFLHVQNVISSLDLQLHKLVSVTTDGARNMTGKNVGLQAIIINEMKLKELSPPLFFHCIIHQQSACSLCQNYVVGFNNERCSIYHQFYTKQWNES